MREGRAETSPISGKRTDGRDGWDKGAVKGVGTLLFGQHDRTEMYTADLKCSMGCRGEGTETRCGTVQGGGWDGQIFYLYIMSTCRRLEIGVGDCSLRLLSDRYRPCVR